MTRRNRLALLAAAAVFAAASGAARAETPRPNGATKLVLDFEDASIWTSENDSPFECRTERVSQGAKSLRVHYTNKPQWSNVLTRKLPGDWSGFRYLSFDVYLEGDLPSGFGMWARDDKQHKAVESWQLGPGWNTVTMDLDKMARTAELNRAAIIALCLYKENEKEIVAHLDNMYLSKNLPVQTAAKPVRTPDNELLSNGGFEELRGPDDLGSPFVWWTARRWEGASFLAKAEKAVFSGESAAMLDGRAPCRIGWYSPPIKVKAPTKLKLTFHVAAADLKPGRGRKHAAVLLTDYGERAIPGAAVEIPGGTYDWKRIEFVCDVPPKCPVVKVFVHLYGAGRLWIDDVSMTGVDLAAELGATVTENVKTLDADPPLVTESARVLKMKARALRSMETLRGVVAEAKAAGKETLYDEIPLILGQLTFEVRWDMPQHLDLREGYCDYIIRQCELASRRLRLVMAGRAPDLQVPAHPDFGELRLKGRYFRLGDEPKILFSMQYHRSGELTRWFCPNGHHAFLPAVGATRFNFKSTPVWEAYRKYPGARRVYDNGWCGHIIRDQWSAGGSDRCVISLESPRMREAISKSMVAYVDRLKRRATPPTYVNMGFEYSYVNYDAISKSMFHEWLKKKHGRVAKLNAVWKTSHRAFADIELPSYNPWATEPNPAKYYDWGEFNLWRFTDYMKWAKGEITRRLPGTLTTTGGGQPFGAGYWRQGIDEEALSDEGVCDIWLSETGSRALGITSVMDLQRSLAPGKPILDPEYHALANTCYLMFLHGCGLMDYWWWPGGIGDFYDSSMKHSHTRTLLDVQTVMRTALDVRRLGKYIARFGDGPAEVALLYPEASLIQRFPGAKGHKTPFSMETERSYAAAARLDAPVGFASSKRVLSGALSKYKLLIIPGCRYVKPEVFAKITAFVESGGWVVVTPTSLVADEYSRRRDYLAQLGIEIVSEERPEMMAGAATRGIDQEEGELDFIQGPVAKTIVTEEPKRDVVVTGKSPVEGLPPRMAAEGIIQYVKASGDWGAFATYAADGAPALLLRSFGQGRIYYLAAQLTVADRRRLFDRLMEALQVKRPVRALAGRGRYPEGVESRTVQFEGGYLTYLHNLTRLHKKVALSAPGARIASVFDLTTQSVSGARIALPPQGTRILKVEVVKQ